MPASEYCAECGRKLTSGRSIARGFGGVCFAKFLDALPPERQQTAAMSGYGWFQSGDLYIVVTPEHETYQVSLDDMRCSCPAFDHKRRCKHIDFLQRETGRVPARRTFTPEEKAAIQLEILNDF